MNINLVPCPVNASVIRMILRCFFGKDVAVKRIERVQVIVADVLAADNLRCFLVMEYSLTGFIKYKSLFILAEYKSGRLF
jgi:hypothetical protein